MVVSYLKYSLVYVLLLLILKARAFVFKHNIQHIKRVRGFTVDFLFFALLVICKLRGFEKAVSL